MAISNDNDLIRGFHGKIGNQVSLRRRDGKTIMASVPTKKRSRTKGKQRESCDRFRKGLQWAKQVLKNPDQYAAYKEKATEWQTALNVALADYMKSPVVTGINSSFYHGCAGDTILVTATDNFHVKEVSIKICSQDGKVLESGLCQADQTGSYWQYIATKDAETTAGITITGIARDNPGHTGEMKITLG